MSDMSNRNLVFRGVSFVFGVFLLAMGYNLLLLPNNLVVGGMSGLSIMLNHIFGIDPRLFIYISSFALLVVSFIFLGKQTTYNTAIGSILYPVMITLTEPIARFILNRSDVTEIVVVVTLAGITYGVSNGIIYKMGFTTGGSDVLMQLMSKYMKISSTKANFICSFVLIMMSAVVFGISTLIYAIIILVISNIIIDKIIVGISNSKVFFISTKKLDEMKKMIHLEYESGLTDIPTKSTMFHKKGELLMVVIPNREYYNFKNRILEIDPQAFYIINDCYEVTGGKRHSNIPFEN